MTVTGPRLLRHRRHLFDDGSPYYRVCALSLQRNKAGKLTPLLVVRFRAVTLDGIWRWVARHRHQRSFQRAPGRHWIERVDHWATRDTPDGRGRPRATTAALVGSPVPGARDPSVDAVIDRAGAWQARVFNAEGAGCAPTACEKDAQQIIDELMRCLLAQEQVPAPQPKEVA
jgi:hypothetical protein